MRPKAPTIIGHGAERMKLICFATLKPEDRRVVKGESLAGLGPREEAGLAIMEGDGGYYLFTCDRDWNVMWDSWSQTIEDCKRSRKVDWMTPQ
jgi:hypothetical protein